MGSSGETFNQENRLLRITTTLPQGEVGLEKLSGREAISAPFRFKLKLLSENRAIDLKSLLRQPATVVMTLADGTARYLNGIFRSLKQGPWEDANENRAAESIAVAGSRKLVDYEAILVPKLWLLSLQSDCRIWQNKTAPEIVEGVLSDASIDYKLSLNATYRTREYCVQYRETTLNFISRLLEEEGIFYYFEHEASKHTMVLADQSPQLAVCPSQARVSYKTSEPGEDSLSTLNRTEQVSSGQLSLNDYNFETPKNSLLASAPGQDEAVYDYHGRYSVKSDGSQLARVRIEELEAVKFMVWGKSHCRDFRPGYYFTLQDHYRSDTNQDYVITSVTHDAVDWTYRWIRGGEKKVYEYNNNYQAIPKSVPYRPPRLAKKPVVQGSQTALVVGKSGEEIWVDSYGRVKVQFYWDRVGKKDENSSCWVRVSQIWAGKNWGWITIPRIGQEVIVDFLEGDPDYPIITGRVYNADQTVPYTLPDNQTVSGIRSRSSKDASGDMLNEIRFEDKKDAEDLFMQAQKDMDVRVKNIRKEWVGKDAHLTVDQDRFKQVGRDEHIIIKRDRMESVTRDSHVTINGKSAMQIQGSHSLAVTGNVAEKFQGNHSEQAGEQIYLKAGMNVVIEAGLELTLKVGGNFIDIGPTGVTIQGTMVLINSGGAAGNGTPGTLVSPTAPTAPLMPITTLPTAATTVSGGGSSSGGSSNGGSSGSASSSGSSPSSGSDPSSAAAGPTHDPNADENKEKTHWVAIQLVDESGQPIAGEAFEVKLPDGSVYTGTTGDKGQARVDHIDPGSVDVSFPNLDKDAWEPA